MILCDHVHRDSATNKCSILGTFSNIVSSEFPATQGFCIYFALTDGDGKHEVRVRIQHAKHFGTDQFQFQTTNGAKIDFENPLMVLEGVFVLKVKFDEPGLYFVELECGSQILMSRKLLIVDEKARNEETQ
jgi:hypothetical protein